MIRRIGAGLALAAAAQFSLPNLPLLPGSVVPLSVSNLQPPFDVAVLGPGRVTSSSTYVLPDHLDSSSATLLAANAHGLAMHEVNFASPPPSGQPFIAVASYEEGVVIHDAQPPFAQRAVFGVGGAPSDVAIDAAGHLAAASTDGDSASIAQISPWRVAHFSGAPFADELAFDDRTQALFLTNRDVGGAGALTRIAADGSVRQRRLGLTAEGIAIDEARGRIYVANTNEDTVSIVDGSTLVELQRFRAVARVFGLALWMTARACTPSEPKRVFAVCGSGKRGRHRRCGRHPHVVARSSSLAFPVGVAVDSREHRVFVTDEHDDVVHVLDAASLRPAHAPLKTCRTPWKPALAGGLLYVPCARANRVDVFDARTLRRIPGAPFATGGYPLAVAVWHPDPKFEDHTP